MGKRVMANVRLYNAAANSQYVGGKARVAPTLNHHYFEILENYYLERCAERALTLEFLIFWE